jgi:hypothetical protein
MNPTPTQTFSNIDPRWDSLPIGAQSVLPFMLETNEIDGTSAVPSQSETTDLPGELS